MTDEILATPKVYLMTAICTFLKCRKPFIPTNKRQRFCTAKCRAAAHYLPKKIASERRKIEAQALRNARFRMRNRDRALGFDGKYGGPDCPSYGGTPVEVHRPDENEQAHS